MGMGRGVIVFVLMAFFSLWGFEVPLFRPGVALVLLFLLALLWVGPAYVFVRWHMFGPPLETFGLLGLWVWAVVESRRRWSHGAMVSRNSQSVPVL